MLTLQTRTANRLADSADAQTVSAFYEQDVQSSSNITTNPTATPCGPGTQLLGLEWDRNAQTGQYEDLVKAGVIDPTKVTRSALQNAASISALMLTTEAMICEIPEKKNSSPMPGGHDHGGGMDF